MNLTPAESVVKEVREESGYEVRVRKLAAVWDRTRQGHRPAVFSCVKLFFLCDLMGGESTTSHETSGVDWFSEGAVPVELSTERTLPHQVKRMFEHARDRSLSTDFE